jgi:hypothetical protein
MSGRLDAMDGRVATVQHQLDERFGTVQQQLDRIEQLLTSRGAPS